MPSTQEPFIIVAHADVGEIYKAVGGDCLALWLILKMMQGQDPWCDPGKQYLAERMGVHKSSIKRWIEKLADGGFITITARVEGTVTLSNQYTVNSPSGFVLKPRVGAAATPGVVASEDPGVGSPTIPKKDPVEKNMKTKETAAALTELVAWYPMVNTDIPQVVDALRALGLDDRAVTRELVRYTPGALNTAAEAVRRADLRGTLGGDKKGYFFSVANKYNVEADTPGALFSQKAAEAARSLADAQTLQGWALRNGKIVLVESDAMGIAQDA